MVYGPILYIDRYYYLGITKDFTNCLDYLYVLGLSSKRDFEPSQGEV